MVRFPIVAPQQADSMGSGLQGDVILSSTSAESRLIRFFFLVFFFFMLHLMSTSVSILLHLGSFRAILEAFTVLLLNLYEVNIFVNIACPTFSDHPL